MSYKTKTPTIAKEDLNAMMSMFRDKYGKKAEMPALDLPWGPDVPLTLDKPIKPIAPKLERNEIESILLDEVEEEDEPDNKNNSINSLISLFKNSKTSDVVDPMRTYKTDGEIRINPYDLDKITAGRKSVIADKNRKYQEDMVEYDANKKSLDSFLKGKKPTISFENLDDTAKNELKMLVNNVYQSSMGESGFTDTQTPKNPQMMKDVFKTRLGDIYPVWQQLKQELLQKESLEVQKYQEALKLGVPKTEADKALMESKSKIWGY